MTELISCAYISLQNVENFVKSFTIYVFASKTNILPGATQNYHYEQNYRNIKSLKNHQNRKSPTKIRFSISEGKHIKMKSS